MGAREEYDSKKAADKARQEHARQKDKKTTEAAILGKKWFFNHPDKIVRYTGWLQLYTLALFVATLLLFSAAVVTAIILHNTDDKINRQLGLMEADLRPWIKVETEVYQDLDLRQGSGAIPIKFILVNVGKSPAFNVEILPRPFLLFDGHTDLFGEQKDLCKVARDERQNNSRDIINAGRGIFIFPNERIPWERFGGIIGTGPIPDDLKKYSRTVDGKREIDLWIFGCVTYDFGRPDTVHQTGFVYRIARIISRQGLGSAMSFIINPDEIVPKDLLLLFPNPSADGVTN